MRALGRRGLRLISATLLLAGLLIAFMPTGSGAEEPLITGWWQRDIPLTGQSGATAVIAQIASSPRQIPPPPTVPPVTVTVPPDVTIPDPGPDAPLPDPTPPGGLMVANDPAGPRAMAALRFDAPTAAGGIVTLQVTDGSTPAPAIRACPSLSDWQAGPNQAWSRRPAHDCGRVAVASTVATDGTVTFELPDDFRNPDAAFFDVILVPAEGDGTPFQTVFVKPGADAFEVTSTLVPEEEYDSGNFDFDVGTGTDDSFGTYGYSFDEPTTRPANQPTASNRPEGAGGAVRRIAGVLENPTSRRIAALALIVIGGYAYWQSGQAVQRRPQLLGALGGGSSGVAALAPARPRGIGRFSRPRTERPPRF